MMPLKLVVIITSIACILWLTYLYIPFTSEQKKAIINFCDDLKKGKELCISYKSQCEITNPQDPINCVAGMLVQANEVDAAHSVCSKKEGLPSIFCFAISLALKDVNSALMECDKIIGPEKYHCKGDVWKEAGNITRALEECDNILVMNRTDYDPFYKCKASVYRAIDKKEALEFCKNITSTEIRKDCEMLAAV
ncbi:MAG: hypothetical protein QW609_02840 [Candidatus Aenigmatarchaeota archaeon]